MLKQTIKTILISTFSAADTCNESAVLINYLPCFMIDHNVVWLDISMHDALAVTVFQRLQTTSTDCSTDYHYQCTVLQLQQFLTHSTPAVQKCCCSKGSVPYWSNPLFLIFDIQAFWRSVLSARTTECQKLKMVD